MTHLENGMPKSAPTFINGIVAYCFTIVVSIALFILFKSYQTMGNNSINRANKKSKISLKNGYIVCLLFSFVQSLSWLITTIALLIMVSQQNNANVKLMYQSATIVAYTSKFLFAVFIAHFVKTRLFQTFGGTSVKISECSKLFWNFFFVIYACSAIVFNLFFLLTSTFNLYQIAYIERVASYIFGILSIIFYLLVLIQFLRKLQQYISLPVEFSVQQFNDDAAVQKIITKQATLISLIAICEVIYIIDSYYCFHVYRAGSVVSLIAYYWVYLITQSIVLICAFLTFNFKHNYYDYVCCCCHSFCLSICSCTPKPLMTSLVEDSSSLDGVCNESPTFGCGGVHQCESVQSICDTLDRYKTKTHMDSQDTINCVNNYHHLLQYHDSKEDFATIYNKLTPDNHAHWRQCSVYLRHYSRRRNRVQQFDNNNHQHAHCKQRDVSVAILDKIHSFYYHSYDRGLRENISVTQDTEQKLPTNDDETEVTELCNSEKYISSFDSNNEQDLIYKFGKRFVYGKDLHQSNIFVNKYYKNLKIELLRNMHSKLHKTVYDEEMQKAEKYFKTKKSRLLNHRNKRNVLNVSHILALLVYCNCDMYQLAWAASFRRQSFSGRKSFHKGKVTLSYVPLFDEEQEEIEEEAELTDLGITSISKRSSISNDWFKSNQNAALVCRHEKFYWCSKYLIDLVESFGDNLFEDNRRTNKSFYRGVGQMLFPTRTIAQFNGPLSTSEDIVVAQRFAGNNGMILVLNYAYSTSPLSAKYFDCKYFSDYSVEKECLFIGGIPMMIIQNIVNISNGEQYKDYLNAINIIHSLLNGTYNNDDIKGLYLINDESIDLCCDLLSNQLQDCPNDAIPLYVTRLVENYCYGLHYVITFWHQFENNKHLEPLKKLFSAKEISFFDLDHLLRLFPNIEQIEYLNDSFESKTYFDSKKQTTALINNILENVTLIEDKQIIDLKLQRVIIHHNVSVDNSNDVIKNTEGWMVQTYTDKIMIQNNNIKSKKLSIRLPEIQRGLSSATFLSNSKI